MSHDAALILIGLSVFQLKHFLCDFVLQTSYQFKNKGYYGHPGGLVHAGLHGIGSIPALLVFTQVPATIAMLVVGEMIVHYHTDWLKEQIDRRMNWTYEHAPYWFIFGGDQVVHQFTYIGIVALLMSGMFAV